MTRAGRYGLSVVTAAVACAVAPAAWAQNAQGTVKADQTPVYDKTPIRAPKRALELGVDAGFTQPFGDLYEGQEVGFLINRGFTAGLDVGYRISPRWGLGVGGHFHESRHGEQLSDGSRVRGLATDVNATYHFQPYERIDPYLTLGTGYRGLWVLPPGTADNTYTHGLELARGRVGIDVRVTKDVAMGPYIGADANMFLWQNRQAGGGDEAFRPENRGVTTFVNAGVAGRFDIGGERVSNAKQVVYAPVRTYFLSNVIDVPNASTATVTRHDKRTNVVVAQNILDACGIAQPKAFFKFDSSNLQTSDSSTLDSVAQCLTTGPLAGHKIEVVGHADPRGSDDYNMELGENRAQSVGAFMSAHGVPNGSVLTSSQGEEGTASHDTEREWAWDRRVDIKLAK